MNETFSPRHLIDEVGGNIQTLREFMRQDQAEFDAAASKPWWPLPSIAGWSAGIAGGRIELPQADSVVELIRYLQGDYRGPFGKYGITLIQAGIRSVCVWRDKPARLLLHRPSLVFEHHRRLVKTGVRITTSPIIEMEFTP